MLLYVKIAIVNQHDKHWFKL